MKFSSATPLIACALAFAAAASTGCAKNNNTLASERVDQTPADTSASEAATPVATPVNEPARDTWDRIKDYTYEQQADFVAGYHQLAADSDVAIQKLDAKRATMTDTASKDWDIAMKELKDARSDLDDKLGQLKQANSDTWNDAKDKATAAWKRVVDDLDKVRRSTTS